MNIFFKYMVFHATLFTIYLMKKMNLFTAAALFFIKQDKVFLKRIILDINLFVPSVQ